MQKLIDCYGDSLLRLCYLYLHDLQLAEDAVQETYLRIYRSYASFRGDGCSEKTWMTRIAINVCKSMRRSAYYRHIFLPGGAPLSEDALSTGDLPVWDDTVLRAVALLRPKYRAVVLLFYYQQLSTRETASALGISESAVSARLSRARAELREQLKGWYFDA